MSRRDKLLAMLEQTPSDPFLRYAVAMEDAKHGDLAAAITRLQDLQSSVPEYVPTYLQLAQRLVEADRTPEAAPVLLRGIEAARRSGDDHAEGELRGMLQQVSE